MTTRERIEEIARHLDQCAEAKDFTGDDAAVRMFAEDARFLRGLAVSPAISKRERIEAEIARLEKCRDVYAAYEAAFDAFNEGIGALETILADLQPETPPTKCCACGKPCTDEHAEPVFFDDPLVGVDHYDVWCDDCWRDGDVLVEVQE